MKTPLSERFVQMLHGGADKVPLYITLGKNELKTIGILVRLETEYKYAMIASGMDRENKIYWDELAKLSKEKLDEIAKKHNLQ